jgi:hypothetical protein
MNRQKSLRPGADILVYKGKHGRSYWLIDTPVRRDAAFRTLFEILDECCCYEDGEDGLTEARAGDAKAIRSLLERHNGYEYEEWDIEFAEIPE